MSSWISTEFTNSANLLIENFYRAEKKVPFLHNLQEHPIYWPLFSNLTPEQLNKIEELLEAFFIKKITSGNTKGQKILHDLYLKDSKTFLEFRKLNRDRSFASTPEFQALGAKVKDAFIYGEDKLLSNQENWKFRDFSSTTGDSFKKLTKNFFPLIEYVWVVIRYIQK